MKRPFRPRIGDTEALTLRVPLGGAPRGGHHHPEDGSPVCSVPQPMLQQRLLSTLASGSRNRAGSGEKRDSAVKAHGRCGDRLTAQLRQETVDPLSPRDDATKVFDEACEIGGFAAPAFTRKPGPEPPFVGRNLANRYLAPARCVACGGSREDGRVFHRPVAAAGEKQKQFRLQERRGFVVHRGSPIKEKSFEPFDLRFTDWLEDAETEGLRQRRGLAVVHGVHTRDHGTRCTRTWIQLCTGGNEGRIRRTFSALEEAGQLDVGVRDRRRRGRPRCCDAT